MVLAEWFWLGRAGDKGILSDENMTFTLSPPDLFYLQGAQGWLELGNPAEAEAELNRLRPDLLEVPAVLDVRWELLVALNRWEESLEVASKLMLVAPEVPSGWVHRSFALHELKRTVEARDNLLRVVDKFPNDTIMRYNLACYECQLGRLDQARAWFQKACEVGVPEKLRAMAMDDPDLEPLRKEGGL
jgi:tetratricopeptide (TPR) repeat protein